MGLVGRTSAPGKSGPPQQPTQQPSGPTYRPANVSFEAVQLLRALFCIENTTIVLFNGRCSEVRRAEDKLERVVVNLGRAGRGYCRSRNREVILKESLE